MLTLLPGQSARLEARIRERYLAGLVTHAQGLSPRLCEVAGPAQVRTLVETTLQRALAIGWDQQHLVRFYLDLAITFGCDCATDPQYPWIALHLRRSDIESGHTLACRLHADYRLYARTVVGDGGQHVVTALQRLLSNDLAPPAQADDLSPSLWAALDRVYPQKAFLCGREALDRIVERARDEAVDSLTYDAGGPWVVAGLMLVFGVGVCHDPLYAWVRSTLRAPAIEAPAARVRLLAEKAIAYARHASRYLAAA